MTDKAATRKGRPGDSAEPVVAEPGTLSSAFRAPWSSLNVISMIDRPGIDPARTALVCESELRTYGQIRDRYRRVASALADLGLDRLARVGVTITNRIEYFEIELGIAGAAGVMVALSWRLTAQERINLLRQSKAQAIIAEDQFAIPLVKARERGELPDLRWIVSLGDVPGADLEYEQLCAYGRECPLTVAPPVLADPTDLARLAGSVHDPDVVVQRRSPCGPHLSFQEVGRHERRGAPTLGQPVHLDERRVGEGGLGTGVISSGSGAPPHMIISSALKSRSASSGSCRISYSIVGTHNTWLIRCSAT